MEWTSSPWQAVRSDPAQGADVWWICAGTGNQETELGSFSGGYPEAKRAANAHLAAAAPDLYRACEGLLFARDRAMDYIGNGWQTLDIVAESREARDQAELFMARARGEPTIVSERGPAAAAERDGGF